jgi:YD repeat-containing protein
VGQDYADQRYYNAGMRRFWTADTGGIKTATPANPFTCNRYAYANGDPMLLTLANGGMTETRTYNSMMQLITQSVPGYLNMTCNYSSTQNNGRITSSVDGVTGENTTYTYDALNRLTGGSNSLWSEAYGYDGFGNLTSKSGSGGSPNSAPSWSASYNASNQQVGVSYNANGNTTSANGSTIGYSVENKMNSQTSNAWPFGVSLYGYDPWGKRVMKDQPGPK